MSTKRRVKLPGRFLEEELHWYIVEFIDDGELSDPVSGDDLEDDEGVTGNEKHFHLNDTCTAMWTDGNTYKGKIIFEADAKEKCQKFLLENKKKTESKKKSTPKRKSVQNEANNACTNKSLAKKKKEQNEIKKAAEKSQRETAIMNAEELFKESMMHGVTNKKVKKTTPFSYQAKLILLKWPSTVMRDIMFRGEEFALTSATI
ncbi:uncharacterized protein LOC143057034 [Mytilus galloprovincialis]|uniref:uncharacterized protein LOC143057034 n=1 Tax=Mytilus galloprovincialis TaxID=29158 RepID=UPI003F7C4164